MRARRDRERDVFGGQSYPPESVDEWIRLVSGLRRACVANSKRERARSRATHPTDPRAHAAGRRFPPPSSLRISPRPSARRRRRPIGTIPDGLSESEGDHGGVDERGGQGVRERGGGRGAAPAGRRARGGLVRGARDERAAPVDGGGAAPLRGPGGGRRRHRRRPRPPPALRRGGLRRRGDRGRAWQGPARGSQELRLRLRQGLLQGRAGAAQGHPVDRGGAQAVLAGAGQVRQGRLAEHLAQLRHLPDADAGGEPRAEVLHPPQLHEPGPAPLQHPRHHQHQQRRAAAAAARAHHRPGPRRAGGAAGRHHEASRDGGHVRGRAHGPPGGRPHGPRRRRHAGHVPSRAGPPALRHARRLPGAASVSMHAMVAWSLLWFVRAAGTPACASTNQTSISSLFFLD